MYYSFEERLNDKNCSLILIVRIDYFCWIIRNQMQWQWKGSQTGSSLPECHGIGTDSQITTEYVFDVHKHNRMSIEWILALNSEPYSQRLAKWMQTKLFEIPFQEWTLIWYQICKKKFLFIDHLFCLEINLDFNKM